MHQEKIKDRQENISMEEYLCKRQKIREKERHQWNSVSLDEKSPVWMRTELYV